MKSKEYFEKYFPLVQSAKDSVQTGKAVYDMSMEMASEVSTIASARHAISGKAVMAIIKEQNQKWNSVANLFAQSSAGAVVRRNGFQELMHTILSV